MASSRVGEMTIAPVPFLGMNLARCSSSNEGIKKASVLPEPARRWPSEAKQAKHMWTADLICPSGCDACDLYEEERICTLSEGSHCKAVLSGMMLSTSIAS